ncbi:MAG: glycosyltransferase family 4 protein, partial [Methanomicrobiales archaeon]
MKILQVCHRYYPHIGGAENLVKELSERLARTHDVEVISTDFSPGIPASEILNGVKITRISSIAPGGAYSFAPKIFPLIRKSDADVVHAHNYHAFPAFFASLVREEKFIFSPYFHGKGSTSMRNFLNKPYSLLGMKIFCRANKIICLSEFEKNLIVEKFPRIDTGKFIIIPAGIQIQQIKSANKFEIQRDIILYTGRLDQYKNIQLIIRAMVYLPDVCFVIIGSSGNYKNELKDLIIRFGVSNRVKILENVTDAEKYSWLKTCSLFINLSGAESFGINVLEALAADKPVLVNIKGGLKDFVDKFAAATPVNVDGIKDDEAIYNLAQIIKEKMGMQVLNDVTPFKWENIIER